MKNTGIYEEIIRGNDKFPIAFHYVDKNHPKYEMNLHWHTDSEIIIIEKGILELQLNSEQFSFNSGDIIYIPGGVLHGGLPHDCVYNCIVFSEKTLFKSAPALSEEALHHTCAVFHNDKHAVRCISAAILESKRMINGDIFRIYSNLYAFYAELFNAEKINTNLNRKNLKKINILKNAITMIEKDYSNTITLEMLSGSCGMSPKYFCKFFKDLTGRTPMDYLNLYRIDAACELLCQGIHSVTDTAFLCGFNDLSYFIKTFKKYKNISPGKYASEFISN